jgi:hypothetical protein
MFFLFLTFGITLYCFIANQSKKQQQQQEETKRTARKTEFEKMNSELNEKLNNTVIVDISCRDSEDKMYLLSDLVLKHPILIFRYSELNCNTC